MEPSKLLLASLNTALLNNLETEVLARLSPVYDTSSWIDEATTPALVRVIISKTYASYEIDKAYSENQEETSNYAAKLLANAEMLITGIVNGDIEIPGEESDSSQVASFFPTDASSAMAPTEEHPEYGGPWFSLGMRF